MTLHSFARRDDLAAHSRGRVGAVGTVVGLTLAIAAVVGVGAAATSATWGGASSLGPSSWLVYERPITP